ncbi:MAG: hypothetical protein JNK14_12150 [Chitinophagaceae bacterium]|nr:hypothetical protein [Chitinophagaceae bacterium]
MKKIFALSTLITLAVVITGIQSCKFSHASPAKLMKFNLEKGKGYDYEMVWDMDQKVMGNDTKISIGGMFSVLVTDDNGTEKTMTSTYKRFVMNMKMMGMEIDVDTDKPAPALTPEEMEENPMSMMNRMFSGIAGKSFVMKVDQEGKVTEVSGFREIIQSMVDSVGIGEEMKQMMTASLNDQFNDQSLKDQFAQVFTIFPNKEVKVGDSWEKSYSTGGKMAAKFNTHYTVKEMEGDIITLDSKTRIEPTEDNGSGANISGDQTGIIKVDTRTGLMIAGDFDQKMDIKASGVSIQMNGKGKIKGKAH